MLRVAAAQLRVTLDRADNIRRAAALVDAAAREGAQLVALPEVFTGKYGVQHFSKWQEGVAPPSANGGAEMMASAARRHGIAVTGGVVDRHAQPHGGHILYNAIPAFGPDGDLVANYRKVHLSRVLGVTSESDVFTPGWEPASFDAGGDDPFLVGLVCCFDLRFPAFLAAYGPYAGGPRADVLAAPSAFLEATGVDHWDLLCRRTALDAQAYVVAPNVAYDASDAVPLHGRSLVCDPWGDVLAQTAAEGDDLAIADVDRERLADVRKRLPLAREGKGGF